MIISAAMLLYSMFMAKAQKSLLRKTAIPAAFIIIFLLTGLVFNPFKEEASFASRYNRSIDHISKQDYEKAASLLEELEKENPTDDQVALAQGILYLKMAGYDNSWNYLSKAYNLNPYDINVLYNMGINRYHRGNLSDARNYFERVAQTAPRILKAHVYAGTVSMELNDYKRAIYHLENARFLEPEAAAIYLYLAKCHLQFMDYEKVEQNLSWAASKDTKKYYTAEISSLNKQIAPYIGGDVK
jgi:tetratricopeptide (TPR) repeat protein